MLKVLVFLNSKSWIRFWCREYLGCKRIIFRKLKCFGVNKCKVGGKVCFCVKIVGDYFIGINEEGVL